MGFIRVLLWIFIILMLIFIGWRRYKKGNLVTVIWGILLVGLLVYTGFAAMLFFMQSRMLYYPLADYITTPEDIDLPYESVVLNTADGQKISGWYIPAASEPAQWTVLYCHGNAGNISHRLDTLQLIHELGANCLIIDYRGYGQSTGKPTEQGTLVDVRTGWDWLVNEQKISPEGIILFGRSLGGSIAATTAVDVKPAAVIIESSFTSFVDMGRHLYPWLPVRLFARFKYDTLEAVKKLECPVFIAHSPDDEIVPYKFAQQLYQTAPEPKLFRDLKGTHNEGFYENPQIYRNIWQEWLNALDEIKGNG